MPPSGFRYLANRFQRRFSQQHWLRLLWTFQYSSPFAVLPPEPTRLLPNKVQQLTVKDHAAIDLWYSLAPNSGAPVGLGKRPLPAAERPIR